MNEDRTHGWCLISPVIFAAGILISPLCLAHLPNSESWVGTVTVIKQAGESCKGEPTPPYQRKVMASSALIDGESGLGGRLFFSGDTEAMEANGERGAFSFRPLLSAVDAPGVLVLSRNGSLLVGLWREAPSPRASVCSWTEARIELEPAPLHRGEIEPATPNLVEQAFRVVQHLTSPATQNELEQVSRLNDMVFLGQTLVQREVRNVALARLFLDASDQARLMGQRGDALALIGLSSQLHRLVAFEYPQATAEALSREAAALRAQRRRVEAEALYKEALSILELKGLRQTATGSSVLNSLGALYLLMGSYDEAVLAFKQALTAQRHWGAPSLDVAGTMNNLAHVFARQGDTASAVALFDEALNRLAGESEAEQALAAIIRESAAGLRGNTVGAVEQMS